MAIYRFSIKHGSRGNGKSGGAHARYILRETKYDYGAHELKHTESSNLPPWANSAAEFWDAADKSEQANARIYTEFEIALPRELTTDQQIRLAQNFIRSEVGDRHPYTMAIHEPKASDSNPNPHIHVMFTTRTLDGIERSEAVFFKRANSKQPEQGGAPKERSWIEKRRLEELRESWQEHANLALKRAGHEVTIDHRSLEAQGIDRSAEPKLTPYETMLWKQGIFSEKVEEVLLIRELAALEKTQEANERILTTLRELAILRDSEARIGETLAEQKTLLESALTERERIDSTIENLTHKLSYAPGTQEDAYEMAKDRLYGRALEAHTHSLAHRRAERDRIAKEIDAQVRQGWGMLRDLPHIFQDSIELVEAQQMVNAAREAYQEYVEAMASPEAKAKCEAFAGSLYATKVEDETQRNALLEEALAIRERIPGHEVVIADLEGMLADVQHEIEAEERQLPPALRVWLVPGNPQITVGQTVLTDDLQELEGQRQRQELKQQLSLKLAQDKETE